MTHDDNTAEDHSSKFNPIHEADPELALRLSKEESTTAAAIEHEGDAELAQPPSKEESAATAPNKHDVGAELAQRLSKEQRTAAAPPLQLSKEESAAAAPIEYEGDAEPALKQVPVVIEVDDEGVPSAVEAAPTPAPAPPVSSFSDLDAPRIFDNGGNVAPAPKAGERTALSANSHLSLGTAAVTLGAVTRLRAEVRLGYLILAKRLGMVLMLCSCINALTLSLSLAMEQLELYAMMTNALSVSGFVLHISLALGHDSIRAQSAAHFGVVVLPVFINGAFDLVRRDFVSAVYNLVAWGLIFSPLLGWGLRRLLDAVQRLPNSTKDALSHSTVAAFAYAAGPILYFLSNGMLCVTFESEAHCSIRANVNYVSILAILGNAILFVLLTLTPVTLKQAVSLDLPAPQLATFFFYGILLGLALGLHSQNENFGPVTPAITYMGLASDPSLLLFFVAFVFNILKKCRTAMLEEATRVTTPPPAVGATEYGDMVPHRIVMGVFTALLLVVEAFPVGDVIRSPCTSLSLAAAVFHILMRAEDVSATAAKLHFFAHASSAGIVGARRLRDGDFGAVMIMCVYLVVFYPGVFIAATRFRSSVRSHGTRSAAKLAATSFVTFWVAVCPVLLYLSADSFGAFLFLPQSAPVTLVLHE